LRNEVCCSSLALPSLNVLLIWCSAIARVFLDEKIEAQYSSSTGKNLDAIVAHLERTLGLQFKAESIAYMRSQGNSMLWTADDIDKVESGALCPGYAHLIVMAILRKFRLRILTRDPKNRSKLILLEDFKPQGLSEVNLCINVLWSTGPEHYDLLKPRFVEPRPLLPVRVVPISNAPAPHAQPAASSASLSAASGSSAQAGSAPKPGAPAPGKPPSAAKPIPQVPGSLPAPGASAPSVAAAASVASSAENQQVPMIGPQQPDSSSLALVKSAHGSGLVCSGNCAGVFP